MTAENLFRLAVVATAALMLAASALTYRAYFLAIVAGHETLTNWVTLCVPLSVIVADLVIAYDSHPAETAGGLLFYFFFVAIQLVLSVPIVALAVAFYFTGA